MKEEYDIVVTEGALAGYTFKKTIIVKSKQGSVIGTFKIDHAITGCGLALLAGTMSRDYTNGYSKYVLESDVANQVIAEIKKQCDSYKIVQLIATCGGSKGNLETEKQEKMLEAMGFKKLCEFENNGRHPAGHFQRIFSVDPRQLKDI